MNPLAFIDCETTGLDPSCHEILEIAVLRVDPTTFEVLGEFDTRVLPTHIETADPKALAVNGYLSEAWTSAIPLEDALHTIAPLLEGAMLAGQNPAFDQGFLQAAWKHTAITPPPMDYHLLDSASLAWPLVTAGIITGVSLNKLCAHLGIDRPTPHRAIDDARAALEVVRRLLPTVGLSICVSALQADERAIVETLVSRIDVGRKVYGPWHVDDRRDYPREALYEVYDGLAYVAAALVRIERASQPLAAAGA